MSNLPEWIQRYKESVDLSVNLAKALAIAWEALEQYEVDLESNGQRAIEAMRRIEELGK